MDSFILTLKEKEKELVKELENSPIYKKLEGIRTTIQLFQGGNDYKETLTNPAASAPTFTEYNDETMTWKQKVLFALQNIQEGFVPDIVAELKQLGAKEEDEFLEKRVSVTTSNLKTDNLIKSVAYGKKAKYMMK